LQFELGWNCGSLEVIEPIVMSAFGPLFFGLPKTNFFPREWEKPATARAEKWIAFGRTSSIASAVGVGDGVAVIVGVGLTVLVGVALAVAVGVSVAVGVGADDEPPSGWS
jgi:hypothetical protein